MLGPLTRTEGEILDNVWPIQDTDVAREPLCDVRIPSGALLTLLRIIC